MDSNDHIVGIDLGTTNSVVAVLENDQPLVIVNSEGSTRTPSVVSFLENGDVVVGEIARRQSTVNPTRTVSSIKRLMGRNLDDIERLKLRLGYEVTEQDNQLLVKISDKGYTPAQMSAMVLAKLKQAAEDFLGEPVNRAIITVPAYFDDLQRQATYEAGEIAGLQVMRLVNEPTAAAMAYGLGRATDERVVIYDFGGGTFDLTVLDIVDNTFEVLTSTGDTHLGGDDIDQLLVEHLLKEFAKTAGADFVPDPLAVRRLKDAAEKAKCDLSIAHQAAIQLPFLSYTNGQPVHFEATVTREQLEDLIYPLVSRTVEICKLGLRDCGLDVSSIDKVILVGGSCRIPLVQEMVESFFRIAPFKGINPDEIVAMGAATQGGVLSGKLQEVLLLDVTPHSLGVEVRDNRVTRVVEKNSTIPIKAAKIFTTTEDAQDMVLVHVVQGEKDKANENRSLGKVALTGLETQKAGIPRIQVTFHINANGMVEVSAQDLATKQEKQVALTLGPTDDSGTARRERTRSSRRRRPGVHRAGTSTESNEIIAAPVPSDTQAGRRSIRVEHEAKGPSFEPLPGQHRPVTEPVHLSSAPVEASQAAPPPPPPVAEVPPTPQAPEVPVLPQEAQPEPAIADPDKTIAGTRLSEPAKKALDNLMRDVTSPDALESYRRNRAELEAFLMQNVGEKIMDRAHLRLLINLNEGDAARKMLMQRTETKSYNMEAIADLFDFYLEVYPNDDEAIGGRATVLAWLGLLDPAIADFERICSEERGSDVQARKLIELYQGKLRKDSEDRNTQYKLVKLLVREKRLDDAISILQQLSESESYRARAVKILGLCYWQKGMHYLAWQKFQQLPASDELKDILYRLAADMEDTDQLLNAKVVLHHVVSIDPGYRDVQARLRKVEQYIRQQAADVESSKTPSAFLNFRDSRFLINEEINRGSMGIVYRAKDTVLEETVALKVLNDYMMADPMAVERFKREARAAKKLSHPNIVRIHDMFEYGNKKLLSMEYIEGDDVKKILREQKTIPTADILKIAKGVCDALGYAHQLGIVHRDIKPANIMITRTGTVKVTDFGIAKFLLAGPESTRSGSQILGTPLYMSPEQIRGDRVDARSDIYSLGATLYETACGKPPFCEGNIEYHHLHTPAPALPPFVPEPLASAIMKCLEKSPAKRFQTINELSLTLQAITG